ncbi:hypothetical protein KAX97_12910 [candidate division WOR-3 bacterium]|nr:hypothetical protein [candidate division WOR-3 bacterium]
MKKEMGSILLILGIIVVILSTAYLIHYDEPSDRIERILQMIGGTSEKPLITYVLLGLGVVTTMIGVVITIRQQPDKKRLFIIPIEYLNRDIIGFTIARIMASVLLIWALSKHSNDYYTLLRFVVCGATAYGTFLAVRFKQISWVWIFGIVAVLFNPIFPIHLERSTWVIIDVSVALILIVSIFLFSETKSKGIEDA